MSHPSNWPPGIHTIAPSKDEYDSNIDIGTHLNLPKVDYLHSTNPFKEIYDTSFRTNPSKRLRESDPIHDTHFKKDGYLLAKDKSIRHFEITQSTLITVMELLYREIGKLHKQMNEIHESIKQLASLHFPIQSSLDRFSEKLHTLTEVPSAKPAYLPSSSHLIEPNRKSQVFIRNLLHSVDDSLTLTDLCTKINSPLPTKYFRVKGTGGIRPLIVTFSSDVNALTFLRLLSQAKRDGLHSSLISPLIARPNYTVEDKELYHSAWAEACAKNDESGKMLFVVRNLRVVRLESPGEWIQKERFNR